MRKFLGFSLRWGPAVVIMIAIFGLSAQTGSDLPNFGSLDYAVKKAGHFLGYGLLGLADWRALGFDRRQIWLAWFLALSYAATDEFHQSFVAGRHPSVVDVLLFDRTGAVAALWLGNRLKWK